MKNRPTQPPQGAQDRPARPQAAAGTKMRRRVLTGLGALLVFILALSVLQKVTGEPVWDEFYQMFGLQSPGVPATPASAPEEETAVHFIDIGQGDAVLIEQGGEYCLIDAGVRENQDSLIAYLEEAGATHLTLLVMTHPHFDHTGGMREVLRRCTVDRVLLPDLDKAPPSTAYSLEKILREIDQQKIPADTVRVGESYAIGSGTLQVLGEGVETENYNDLSPVLRYVGPHLTFVDSGDGERPVEADALARGEDLAADLFKAAHHGSNSSNTEAFLQAIHPSIVVACCGKDNEYGHPHREPRQRFAELGAELYRTDLDGSVVVRGTAEGITVTTSRGQHRAQALDEAG